MAYRDILHRVSGDLALALGLLTRLPLRGAPDVSRGAEAAWAWPLAGLAPAGLAALAIWLVAGFGAGIAAATGLAVAVIVTGALHEDGLADTADGLWGGWTRERRLEIMKDSHIGTYGVIALCLSLGARWGALWLLFMQGAGPASAALLSSAALSRALLPCVMARLPHARATGLSHSQGRPGTATAAVGLGIGCIAALLLAGGAGFWAVIWAVIVAALLARIAQARIGGQTGDILGATQQMVEIAVLFSLLA